MITIPSSSGGVEEGHTHTLSDVTDAGSIASQDSSAVDIDGGAIDGTNIGLSSAGSAAFSDVALEGDLTISVNGSGTATPRNFGFVDMSGQEALLFYFGDTYNSYATGEGLGMLWSSYHGIRVVPRHRDLTYDPIENYVADDDSTAFLIDVGVANSTPSDVLHVIGKSNSDTNYLIRASRNFNGTIEDRFKVAASGEVTILNNQETEVKLRNNNGELEVEDATGNTTTLSPHNPRLFSTEGRVTTWAHRETTSQGQYLEVDVFRVAQLLEELTGEKLIHLGGGDE